VKTAQNSQRSKASNAVGGGGGRGVEILPCNLVTANVELNVCMHICRYIQS
jgi:hypothetical protein